MTGPARRASARYLDGDCPAGVLAIFDNGSTARRGGTFDRYTVLYVPTADKEQVDYLGASEHPSSPQGFGMHGEFRSRWEAREYRRRVYRQSARWSDLPADVQRAVRADLRFFAGEPVTLVGAQ